MSEGVRDVAVVAGVVVVAAYLLGSVPVGYLLARRRLHRALERSELGVLLAGGHGLGLGDVAVAAVDTGKILLAATAAWRAVYEVAPGTHSAVANFSDQVLTSWQSVALWAGLAAVVGHLWPAWFGFRGGEGQAPALGLAFVYAPLGFSVGVGVFFLAYALTRDLPRSVVVSLASFVAYEWLAWIFDWDPSWGMTSGPELSLWAAVLGAVMAGRTIATSRAR